MSFAFIPSPHFTVVPDRRVRVVVIHTMEIREVDDAALRCARWFQSEVSEVAAHYCVDAATVIQCVAEDHVAWHARGGNTHSIGVELAGTAAQTQTEWRDPYSLAVLDRAANLVAEICVRHDVPVRRVGAEGLRRQRAGITGHNDVSVAFNKSDHWDPGPAFPWQAFLRRVRAAREHHVENPILV